MNAFRMDWIVLIGWGGDRHGSEVDSIMTLDIRKFDLGAELG